tara:strand:+ start:302 stop:1138 length:837 start_codon:yes stop_codon:yes gene_type:complete
MKRIQLRESKLINLIKRVITEERELNPGEKKTKPIGSFTLCCLWFCADCEWTWGGGQWSPPAGTTGTAGKYANIAPNVSNKNNINLKAKPSSGGNFRMGESRLRRLVKRVINESNIVNEQAFDQGLFMSSMNGDAYSQCMLCKQMYMFDASKKQSRCNCSNCPCMGNWQQQLQCMICNRHYMFSSAKRKKYCKCSSCVCSAGWTGVNSGLPADIPGELEYDSSIKYQGVDSGLSADIPTLGVDKNFKGSREDMPSDDETIGESDLRRIIKRTITNYEK